MSPDLLAGLAVGFAGGILAAAGFVLARPRPMSERCGVIDLTAAAARGELWQRRKRCRA
jgi:hypothetical protein